MPDHPADLSTYVGLLRGINVGGKNRLPMADLVRMFEDAGCTCVKTYIQSGNVVFKAPRSGSLSVRKTVAAAVSARIRADIPVILRSGDELGRVVTANPFPDEPRVVRTLHVGFLAEQPASNRASDLDPDRSPPDEICLRCREVYLRLPHGIARTRFTPTYVERVLGTRVTFRNWRTILNLLRMATGRTAAGQSLAGS